MEHPLLRLVIEYLPAGELKLDPNHPRKHNRSQRRRLAKGIKKYGHLVPLIVDESGSVVAGHARLAAARELGMETVPCIRINHLSPEEICAFRIFDNKIAERSEWDFALLALELQALIEIDFDLELTGLDSQARRGSGSRGGRAGLRCAPAARRGGSLAGAGFSWQSLDWIERI